MSMLSAAVFINLATYPLAEAFAVSQREERIRRGSAGSGAGSIGSSFSTRCSSRAASVIFADVRFGRIQRFRRH